MKPIQRKFSGSLSVKTGWGAARLRLRRANQVGDFGGARVLLFQALAGLDGLGEIPVVEMRNDLGHLGAGRDCGLANAASASEARRLF